MKMIISSLLALLLGGCVATQPQDITNVCSIFEDRRAWYKAARASSERWDVPIAVNMAFIYQESGFRARAKPERRRILWIIPGPRPSSAYGYAQAVNSTWFQYERESGNLDASRANFADAIDFVAWYNAFSTRASDIAPEDAGNLYFAYHEGNTGFQRGTHREKRWLLETAGRVQSNASRFNSQLQSCRAELDKNWFQRLLS
ncbi:MAG: hypothetical protein WD396_02390 [Pseudohongiellaceae bacterium]